MAFPKVPISPGFGGFVLDTGFGQQTPALTTITANAGGGQANAVQLTGLINKITVVATAGDSVLLPASNPGQTIALINAAAASCNVFPAGSDAINALAASAAFALAAGARCVFVCANPGNWYTIPLVPS